MGSASSLIQAALPASGAALGAFAIGTGPLGIAAIFAVTFGATLLFAPKEPKFELSNERKQTIRQPTAARRTIYGEQRVSGVMALAATTNNDQRLHLVTLVASHQVDGFGDIFLNEDLITPDQLDAAGTVISGKFANLARFKFHNGAADQAADPDLVVEVPEWTGQHRLQGIAYVYVRLIANRTAYPNGIPNPSVVVRGKPLFDPRDGATRWSNNPALALRDYLTDTRLGAAVPASKINDTFFAAQATICDESVDVVQDAFAATADEATDLLSLTTDDTVLRLFRGDRVRVTATGFPGGLAALTDYFVIPVGTFSDTKTVQLAATTADALAGTAIDITSPGSGVTLTRTGVPRYTADGIIDADESPQEVIPKLLSSCAGRLVKVTGTWRLLVGAFVAPQTGLTEDDEPALLTDDDLRGQIQTSRGLPAGQRFNAVKGTYTSPINNWEPSDYPAVISIALAEQDGETLFEDLELPFTLRPQTAQHIAKIELLRARQDIKAVYPAKLTALRYHAGRTVAVTSAVMGWDAKVFEIADFRLAADQTGDGPYLGVDLVLRETDASLYDFATSEEQVVDPAPNTTLPSAFNVAPPGSVSVSSGSAELAIAQDGTVVAQMRIAWTPPEASFVDRYEVEWKLVSESEYRGVVTGEITLQHVVAGVVEGQLYDVRVRMRNRLGSVSEWVADQHVIVGKSEPPPVPVTFTVQRLADGTRRFSWSFVPAPPADVRVGGGVQIRAFLSTTSDWDAMAPIHTGLLQNSPFETNELVAGVYTLAIKAVDSSGNESADALFISAELGNPRLREVLYSQDDKLLGWPGVKTDCWVTPENTLAAVGDQTWADLPSTWDGLAATWREIVDSASPITYQTLTVDLGADVIFTPQVQAQALGDVVVEMRTRTDAQGDDFTAVSWVALDRVQGARYLQIRATVTASATAPDVEIQALQTLVDGEVVTDDFDDVNTATESAAWFESVAPGHFKIGMRKDSAVISQAEITALQNVGAGWTTELLSKSATISGFTGPAAEFKVYNASGTLADATVDCQIKGPKGAALAANIVRQAIETELAQTITPGASAGATVGQAIETEVGRPLFAGAITDLSPLGLPGAPYVFAPKGLAPSGRTTVWQDDFSPGWETRLPWKFRETDLTAVPAGTMNGFGAVEVTYPAGSLAHIRWGGQLLFPNWPTGYPEGWLTTDVKYHSPYSVPMNQKMPGVFGSHTGWGFPSEPPPPCDAGWLCRYQLEPDGGNHSQNRNAHMYTYDNNTTRVNTVWDGISPRTNPGAIALDVVNRIELYWKENTAFNINDGVVQYRFDPGTPTAHATPTTIRAQKTDFSMYCGSEANRVNGYANEIGHSSFFGGPNSAAWAPLVDCTLTFALMRLEIPAS